LRYLRRTLGSVILGTAILLGGCATDKCGTAGQGNTPPSASRGQVEAPARQQSVSETVWRIVSLSWLPVLVDCLF
jgi:hypothetical protein